MHLFGIRVFEDRKQPTSGLKAQCSAAFAGVGSGDADIGCGSALRICTATVRRGGRSGREAVRRSSRRSCPSAPAPVLTQPLDLRPTESRFFKAVRAACWEIRSTCTGRRRFAKASFANSVRLANLVKDGKIYLSLSDAIALAIENNYDIAIARYDLDIADTDILRAKAGVATRWERRRAW